MEITRGEIQVITTIGPAKPQRSTSNNNSAVTSLEHLDSERCHLLALNNPMPGSPKAATPPHKLCLETSFTSLQSPTTDAQCSVSPHSSTCSHLIVSGNRNLKPAYASSPFALHPVLSWEYAAILEEHHANNGIVLGRSKNDNDQKTLKIDLIHDDWFGLAPLATPESLSEVSSISSRAISSSPKKTKFFTPQNSFNSNECSSTEKFSTPENYPRYQNTSSQDNTCRSGLAKLSRSLSIFPTHQEQLKGHLAQVQFTRRSQQLGYSFTFPDDPMAAGALTLGL
uniref:Uncharacterized protein n=1 Tax=Timema monikensis TaxID=170555 RepID=A0A7R9EDT3_9NEOP|nr:unnamed protein product [Timema monikensis]